MSVRAGIVVTGTEVLGGLISDANGPWLSEQLRAHGVELRHTDYDRERAAELTRRSGHPRAEEIAAENILTSHSRAEAMEVFGG